MLVTDPRYRLEKTPSQEIARWLENFGPRTGVASDIGKGNVKVRDGRGDN